MRTYELVIIGGGSAGMAAAVSAHQQGCRDILLLERDHELGGILLQCIHNGFGLHRFGEELSGPAYAERFISMLDETSTVVKTSTMVIKMTADKKVTYVNSEEGYVTIQAKAIVLAMGCRERTRGAIAIPGYRPSGIWSAGTAQKYLNMDGYLVGKKVFILGSGDIGLIMARRMVLEGAQVLGVAEIMPYSGGLPRNIKQCLEDFDIPLYLSHTVTQVKGKDRVEGVTIAKVDHNMQPIPGTEMDFEVDTLLLSVGLIPENSLGEEAGITMMPKTKGALVTENLETSAEGIFSCGNGLHVHDLVDHVSIQGEKAGKSAALYLQGNLEKGKTYEPKLPGGKQSDTNHGDKTKLSCIVCPRSCLITVDWDEDAKEVRSITGNACVRGENYARNEFLNPMRQVTSTVKITGAHYRRLPVILSGEIPKGRMFDVMEEIHNATVSAPVKNGDVIITNVCGLDVNVIASRSMKAICDK